MFYETLTEKDSIYNAGFINKLFLEQKKDHKNGERILGLFFFDVWMRAHKVLLN
jgi:hypothetical protein